MIEKIKAALKQGQYKNLGLTEKAYEGAAAYIATSITDEAEIETKVNSDEVKALLKSFQSVADEARAKSKNEPTPTPSDPGNQPNPNPEPTPQPDLAAAIASAVEAALEKKLNPLQEELTNIKAAKAKEDAVSALDSFVNGWDYASGFPKERDLAKRVAMKVYKAGGEQMNGDQLIAAFREEFDPAVKEKGVTDFSQPFKSDGGGGEAKTDFSGLAERLKAKGLLPNEN